MKKTRLSLSSVLLLIIAFAIAPSMAAQQGGTTQYVYDDNGRLRAVVSVTGEAAVYDYDAAGNFTGIRRLAATALELLDFFPKQGVPGDQVSFIGVGFGAGISSVSFNGATAQIVSATNTTVVVTVPQAATTGFVTINTAQGTVTTAVPFTVKGVRVDPRTAAIFPNETFQFTAVVVTPGKEQGVTWSVNGVNGGDTTLGSISPTGFYTAPAQPAVLIVRATSNADTSLYGEAIVTVQDRALIKITVASTVSVRRASPGSTLHSADVSVQKGGSASTVYGAQVSVQKGGTSSSVNSANVAVTKAPVISGISPGTIAKGATVSITISGANLGGATTISIYTLDQAPDSNIAVFNIQVNGGGTSLTATLMVNSSAATGKRILVITGTAGNSPFADIGVNTIEIIP